MVRGKERRTEGGMVCVCGVAAMLALFTPLHTHHAHTTCTHTLHAHTPRAHACTPCTYGGTHGSTHGGTDKTAAGRLVCLPLACIRAHSRALGCSEVNWGAVRWIEVDWGAVRWIEVD